MNMLLTISWRNIWRHPARSGILLVAIIAGLWAGIVTMGWGKGMVQQRSDYLIRSELSHAQIHHPEFLAEREPWMHIPEAEEVSRWLAGDERIRNHTMRSRADAMAQSPLTTTGVRLIGVDIDTEPDVTTMHRQLTVGEYLDSDVRQPVFIGERLAEKLNLEIGHRLVVRFQDMDNEITAGAFTISGLYRTASSDFDERNVFVRKEHLSELLAQEPVVHEIAMVLHDMEMVDEVVADLNRLFPGVSAQSWYEISPELRYMNDMIGIMLYFIIGIIMLALAFGILNTMLMAIFERVRELGMLLSIGMSKRRVFSMIMLESVMLSLSGAAAGMLLSRLSIGWLSRHGIDLSMFGDGLAEFGIDAVIYPVLDGQDFVVVAIIVIAATLIASIWPGLKAIRLNPIVAARE